MLYYRTKPFNDLPKLTLLIISEYVDKVNVDREKSSINLQERLIFLSD